MASSDSPRPLKRHRVSDISTNKRQNSNTNGPTSTAPVIEKTTFFTLPRELRHQILLWSLDLESYLTYWREKHVFIAYIQLNRDAISEWYSLMERVSQDGDFKEDVTFCKMAFLKMIVEGQDEEDRSWCAKYLEVQYPYENLDECYGGVREMYSEM
ncbi:hypothetical protein E2P81_ATG09859 [Venturia nashicola]|uniref:Uncharacterized protein n=1 Tax=Venturia nashicola TaxID=86259 RepID=A0A4Z1NEU3_9PEZI|nr:hypothetical protein E6O75_ATG10076 [Venturia nashicola]TLD15011.1 hypothetical protein E2P81_ATG09859 [Venturia nashicola]